ncbi:MAG TPA: hypothetical protein VNJ08_09895 [Bacteriovoracaceae bacterium]|nr:hypothetical protein [Bacteriovoracaceae bacterium]
MRLKRFRFLGEKGQTAVEYMMLLVVSASIGIAFKKKIDEFLVGNPNSLLSRQIGGLTASFEGQGGDGRFRSFPIFMAK